jgi:hypothetical protein
MAVSLRIWVLLCGGQVNSPLRQTVSKKLNLFLQKQPMNPEYLTILKRYGSTFVKKGQLFCQTGGFFPDNEHSYTSSKVIPPPPNITTLL